MVGERARKEEGLHGHDRRSKRAIAAAEEASSHEAPVLLRINGQETTLTVDTRTSLLDALREGLHLTGTKKGCDHGQCGACTVLVNGRRINACLALAVMHEGDEIVTVEGLSRGEEAVTIPQTDDKVNPLGTKGLGEVGIVGTAAAIANAVHHATEVQVRELPITPDKVLM